jgi:hypothetical protein
LDSPAVNYPSRRLSSATALVQHGAGFAGTNQKP